MSILVTGATGTIGSLIVSRPCRRRRRSQSPSFATRVSDASRRASLKSSAT